MTETPKEKIEELIEYYKEYEDSLQTEKCLQELLAYKETVTGIARMLGVTQYDISNKDAELLDVNLNDDAIKNALDRYRAADNTYLNKVTIMALNELLLYRQTKLTPDKVKQMKKELDYFMIDGEFGGNQDWFTNIVMNVGGCGAATACDSCIYLAKYKGMKELYPFDLEQMDKEAYKKFSQIMKPYIRPRVQGVKKPEWYIGGLEKYISDVNKRCGTDYQIHMEKFDGTGDADEAERIICGQIDKELPVPYLMLRHLNTEKYKDFIWHWFLVVGYEKEKHETWIDVATYGEKVRLNLKDLWKTGCEEKGGIVIYEIKEQKKN